MPRQNQPLFDTENVDLSFTEDALLAVAKKALERNTGARGLRSILENVLLDTMYDLPSLTDVGSVEITAEVIQGQAKPVLKSERITPESSPELAPDHLKVLHNTAKRA